MDENAGTPDFVKYHEKQLHACGVLIGRSGYEVHDLHSKPLYSVQIGETVYSVGVDGGVVPYSVDADSAAMGLALSINNLPQIKRSSAETTHI